MSSTALSTWVHLGPLFGLGALAICAVVFVFLACHTKDENREIDLRCFPFFRLKRGPPIQTDAAEVEKKDDERRPLRRAA